MTPPSGALAEALPRHRTAPRRTPVRHPRRVSGPATRPARPASPTRRAGSAAAPRSRTAPRTNSPGLALRALAAYERVADSALLDRLVRGRLWIGLLAFALIGIVAMQLMVLKLNAGIGATLEREAALQRTNAQLGIEAATGTGEGRIEPLAAATGMTFAPSGSVHFVASNPAADIGHAAAALSAPIQLHESAAASSEAQTGSGEAGAGAATGETSAVSSESSSSGESGTGTSEASVSQSGGSESSSTGSSEAAPPSETHSPEASAAATGESEASASAAGGVAAGH
jgi:hypothetical protein